MTSLRAATCGSKVQLIHKGPPSHPKKIRYAHGVLRAPSRLKERCSSRPFVDKKVLQLQFSVVLRGHSCPSWTRDVAVAVLRGPSRSFVDKKALQLQFSVVLRGPPCPSWTKRCCSCSSPWSSVALRVLRGQKTLPLQFFAALRGPSWTKKVFTAPHRGSTCGDKKHETHQRPDYTIQ